jgi:hypothetical protein
MNVGDYAVSADYRSLAQARYNEIALNGAALNGTLLYTDQVSVGDLMEKGPEE